MKQIVTIFGAFLTGDQIADAVSRYARALSKAHDSDVVDLPYRAEGGDVRSVALQVGWLVDLGVVALDHPGEELHDAELVEALDSWSGQRERWCNDEPASTMLGGFWETVI